MNIVSIASWIVPVEIIKTIQIKASPSKIYSALSKGALFTATGIINDSLSINFVSEGQYSFRWPSAGQCHGQFIRLKED